MLTTAALSSLVPASTTTTWIVAAAAAAAAGPSRPVLAPQTFLGAVNSRPRLSSHRRAVPLGSDSDQDQTLHQNRTALKNESPSSATDTYKSFRVDAHCWGASRFISGASFRTGKSLARVL